VLSNLPQTLHWIRCKLEFRMPAKVHVLNCLPDLEALERLNQAFFHMKRFSYAQKPNLIYRRFTTSSHMRRKRVRVCPRSSEFLSFEQKHSRSPCIRLAVRTIRSH
jgi:hypothetical protein